MYVILKCILKYVRKRLLYSYLGYFVRIIFCNLVVKQVIYVNNYQVFGNVRYFGLYEKMIFNFF